MADKKTVNILEDELGALRFNVARHAREASTRAHDSRKLRKRVATLERAIVRHSTGQCRCKTTQACLVRLAKLVPVRRFEEV